MRDTMYLTNIFISFIKTYLPFNPYLDLQKLQEETILLKSGNISRKIKVF
jgi:hypothetical protein